jgi:competence protein ComEA
MERRPREGFLGSAARAVKHIAGSRFAKPAAQAALAASGLLILAVVGRTAVAGSGAAAAQLIDDPSRTPAATAAPPAVTATPPATAGSAAPPSPTPAPVLPRAQATPEEPVVLNAAAEADLRRLPGIGAKRADAILVLRARLGRFRAVEDLLKVRGIGRATLRRLRPLVRLDASPPDAGLSRPPTPP